MGRRKTVRSKKLTNRAVSMRMKRSVTEAKSQDLSSLEVSSHPSRLIVSSEALQNLINMVIQHCKTCGADEITLDASNPVNMIMNCNKCQKPIYSRKESQNIHHLSISDAIAAGAICSGVGYSAVKTIFNSLELQMIGKGTYQRAEKRVGKKLDEAVALNCKRNGEKERELAIEAGETYTYDGKTYAFITVTVDGGWSKRSYGHSYNANSGVGVIIGKIKCSKYVNR
jgi:hypothetical protein